MDQETFNLSIRKFLKMVGVNSQREIEQAVQQALNGKRLQGDEAFTARVTPCTMRDWKPESVKVSS